MKQCGVGKKHGDNRMRKRGGDADRKGPKAQPQGIMWLGGNDGRKSTFGEETAPRDSDPAYNLPLLSLWTRRLSPSAQKGSGSFAHSFRRNSKKIRGICVGQP